MEIAFNALRPQTVGRKFAENLAREWVGIERKKGADFGPRPVFVIN